MEPLGADGGPSGSSYLSGESGGGRSTGVSVDRGQQKALKESQRRAQTSLRIRSCRPGHRQEKGQEAQSLEVVRSYGSGRRGEGLEGMVPTVIVAPWWAPGPTGGCKEGALGILLIARTKAPRKEPLAHSLRVQSLREGSCSHRSQWLCLVVREQGKAVCVHLALSSVFSSQPQSPDAAATLKAGLPTLTQCNNFFFTDLPRVCLQGCSRSRQINNPTNQGRRDGRRPGYQ